MPFQSDPGEKTAVAEVDGGTDAAVAVAVGAQVENVVGVNCSVACHH